MKKVHALKNVSRCQTLPHATACYRKLYCARTKKCPSVCPKMGPALECLNYEDTICVRCIDKVLLLMIYFMLDAYPGGNQVFKVLKNQAYYIYGEDKYV